VIHVERAALPEALAEDLEKRTLGLVAERADGRAARRHWDNARACKGQLRQLLDGMASGIGRCMYCGDSAGTDIDHFAPLFFAPQRAFAWPNHLLACSYCNSHAKREQFPIGDDGSPLLVDPSTENPSDHLFLVLSTGSYQALTPRGKETIKVFGLNRGALEQGRRNAFSITKYVLEAYLRYHDNGMGKQAREVLNDLGQQPFADVREAMQWTWRNAAAEDAELLLGGREMLRAIAVLATR
jgi:hypothetical protein